MLHVQHDCFSWFSQSYLFIIYLHRFHCWSRRRLLKSNILFNTANLSILSKCQILYWLAECMPMERNETYLQNIREYGHAMMSAATAIWSSWSTWHVNRGIKATNNNTQDRVNKSRRGLCTWVKEWEKGNRFLNVYRTTSTKVINFLMIRQSMIWLAKWCKIQENCIHPHSPIYWLTYIHDLLSRSRT